MVEFFLFQHHDDYIIVGSGLAGIAFAETALQNQKSFVVIDITILKTPLKLLVVYTIQLF
jgi:voltage-gated potassium channel Kch